MLAAIDYQSPKFTERKLHNALEQTKKVIKKMRSEQESIAKKIQAYTNREKEIRNALIARLSNPSDETINAIKNAESIGTFDTFGEAKMALMSDD